MDSSYEEVIEAMVLDEVTLYRDLDGFFYVSTPSHTYRFTPSEVDLCLSAADLLV